jgi:formate C-acetyltransferase
MSVKEKDPKRKRELFQIYKNCSIVPYLPSETLWEALQAYWFTYCLVNSGGEFVPLGRVDQNIYPYYKSDVESGRITKEEARDLLGSFLAKCNERICTDTKKCENHYDYGIFSQGIPEKFHTSMEETGGHESGSYDSRNLMWKESEDPYSESNFNFGQSANDWLMNMIIGGLRPDGEDGTNEVSFELLNLRFEMDFLMPTLSARVSSKTPEAFWADLAKCLKHSQGEPAIYNDDQIIPGFVEAGVPIEDARNYTNDGCWECLIPGKSHFSYAHVQNLRCLEWVLTRGTTLLSGEMEGIDTGNLSEFQDFDSLFEAYQKQVNLQIDMQAEKRLENLGLSNLVAPDPLMSTMFDGCIEKGRDLTGRGIVPYTFHLILVTGLADLVDSLSAIKKLVYDRKEATLEEFRDAITNNWEHFEMLRSKVRKYTPKYGNDEDYADEILLRVLKNFENQVLTWRDKQDEVKFLSGIGTFENYAALGWNLSASPDGRLKREALAPNYAPTPGVDINGPTAVIKSATKPNLMRFFCGCPLDISLNSNDFQGQIGTNRMVGIIKSFCQLGGNIATITTTSIEELMDARKNPDQHRNLMVRMGGLSAYFIAMSPAQQENIIQRFSKGALIK